MSWLAKALASSSDVFSGTRNYLLMPPVIPGACSLGQGCREYCGNGGSRLQNAHRVALVKITCATHGGQGWCTSWTMKTACAESVSFARISSLLHTLGYRTAGSRFATTPRLWRGARVAAARSAGFARNLSQRTSPTTAPALRGFISSVTKRPG
jgi:hypothetical protein